MGRGAPGAGYSQDQWGNMMTQTRVGEGQELDSPDELDRMWARESVQRSSRSFGRFVPVIVGLLIGMEVGMGVGLLTPTTPAATARIQILPDPTLSGTVLDSTQSNRFVQGQVLVLGGDDLREAAQDVTPGVSAPEVTATQVESTDVVELKVTARSGAGATALTQALIDAYLKERQQSYARDVDGSIAVVDRQLKGVQQASTSSAARARTSVEYTRLLGLRNALQFNRDSAQLQVPVVQRPRLVDQSRWPAAARDAFVGLVLGGLAGLLLKLLLDRRGRRPDEPARRPSWS